MDNLFSIIDIAKIGLMAEKAKVEVYSSNIANVHNPQYVAKDINFEKLLVEIERAESGTAEDLRSQFSIEKDLIVDDRLDNNIALDQQVALMTESELRYQTISQTIQKKLGLLELVVGGKNK